MTNPAPKTPKSYGDVMATELPTKFVKTNSGDDFLRLQDWVDAGQTKGMLIFISDFGADVLKRNPTWLMDGTFKICPDPFKQVNFTGQIESIIKHKLGSYKGMAYAI